MDWKERYRTAHQAYQAKEYPEAVKDHGHVATTFPKVDKANGLTTMCINYLTWTYQYGNRINVSGRLVDGVEKQASGIELKVKKFMTSSTKKGTADIHAVFKGRHLSIEIKIGRDRMSDNQHKEKSRIERAGGLYWIVTKPEDFFTQLDAVSTQASIFD